MVRYLTIFANITCIWGDFVINKTINKINIDLKSIIYFIILKKKKIENFYL